MCFCCGISIINNTEAAHYICFVFIMMKGVEVLHDDRRQLEKHESNNLEIR